MSDICKCGGSLETMTVHLDNKKRHYITHCLDCKKSGLWMKSVELAVSSFRAKLRGILTY